MATPSQVVKVATKTKKKAVKKTPDPPVTEEKEKMNIFQHMSQALGMQTVKLAQGQIPFFEKIKKIILSLSIYCAIGYVIGMILDMFLKSPYPLATIFALILFIVWIFRNGKQYLKT